MRTCNGLCQGTISHSTGAHGRGRKAARNRSRSHILFDGLELVDENNDPGVSPERVAALIGLSQAWVICGPDDQPVGMAIASEMDGELHLEEIDVLPAYWRRGLGSRLLEHICEWAHAKGFQSITLSTFRDVLWNGPFYRKHGFRDLEEDKWTAYMSELRATEVRHGLRVETRVFMRRDLINARLA